MQRRATKIIKSFRKKLYEEKQSILGLMSLGQRRLRGDSLQMFKIINSLRRYSAGVYHYTAVTITTNSNI